MLADVDNTQQPILVIGAGVPPEWLHGPLAVAGISTAAGPVDWQWNGREMNVTLHGGTIPVKLGPAFAADTPYHVRYENR